MKSPPAIMWRCQARRTLSSVCSSPVSRMTLRWARVPVRGRTPLHRDDLVEDLEVATGQEGAAVDDHVDLVGAGRDRVAGVGELDVHRGPARGESGRHGSDWTRSRRAPPSRSTPCRRTRRPRPPGGRSGRRVGAPGLRGERADLAGVSGPRAWSGRPSGWRGRGERLRRRLDRTGPETGGASAPTWSTPGRPCRNRRSEASDPVTSSTRTRARSPDRGGWGAGHRPSIGLVSASATTQEHPDERAPHRRRGGAFPRHERPRQRLPGLAGAGSCWPWRSRAGAPAARWGRDPCGPRPLLTWVVMLRPALWATARDLVLRGMYHRHRPARDHRQGRRRPGDGRDVGGKRYLSPVIGYRTADDPAALRRRQMPGAKSASAATPTRSSSRSGSPPRPRGARHPGRGTGRRPPRLRLARDRRHRRPVVAFVVWLLVL